MSLIRVRPAAGRIVVDPATYRPLPPDGAVVALDTYWSRRLRDGDCVCIDANLAETAFENTLQTADEPSANPVQKDIR